MNRLREKTTATLLIAIFMISMFSVVIPVNADYNAEAVLKAADRLVANQNPDGGFMWKLTSPPGSSSKNTLGITAIGILKAHEILDKPDYETALAKAYGFVVTYSDIDSWPDIPFLIELADAADKDASLLTAIEAEVSGTTVASIAALAKVRYDGGLLATYGPTATEMAEWILGYRAAYPGYGFWEVRSIVKACLSLESYYPDETYDYYSQAQEATAVIYANLDGGTYPFYIGDETQTYYVIGISGAIEAFSELGIHSVKTREMTELLIGFQSVNGYWDRCGVGGQESVQGTAYAIMALLAQGDEDAMVSALEGNTWLVDTQDGHGGWDPCYLGGTENLEVNSEAAWALYECMSVAKLPRNIDPLYQVGLYQRMELVLTITGKGDPLEVIIEGPFYYRGVDDGDASWHAVLLVTSSTYPRAEPGDEVLCHWKYLDEISAMGWIINAKGFNMHLYPIGPRVGDTPQDGEDWRCEQPVEGKSYGATVTGYLYQIGILPN